jgi:hypothetical protein
MTIQLNPEQEQIVGQAIQAGLIRTPDDAAEIGIAAIRQRLNAGQAISNSLGADEWFQQLTAWSESHAASPWLPDEAIDRDSIYGTRGL